MLDEILTAHADSCVAYVQRAGGEIRLEPNLVLVPLLDHCRIRQRFKSQPVQCIGSIRYQLAQKYLSPGI